MSRLIGFGSRGSADGAALPASSRPAFGQRGTSVHRRDTGRCLIRPRMVADLVRFDDDIDDRATFDDPVHHPVGITHVWVADRRIVANGRAAAERPRRLLGAMHLIIHVKGNDNMRKAIMVDAAVRPAGHYSHAVVANGFAYISGQGPADPITELVSYAFADQGRQTRKNLPIILKGAGRQFAGIQVAIDVIAVIPAGAGRAD